MPVWVTITVSIIGSAAVFSFVEFLITRKDKKQDKKGEVLEAIKKLDEKIDALEARMEEEKATNARIRILGFSDEIMHGVLHSEESFNQALQDITAYEKYCEKHPDYKNAKAKVAIANVQTVYEKCVREGGFLGIKS